MPDDNLQELLNRLLHSLEPYAADKRAKVVIETLRDVLRLDTVKYPFDTTAFRDAWAAFRVARIRNRLGWYKTPQTEQAALNGLYRDSLGIESVAIAAVVEASEKGYRGTFPKKHIPKEVYEQRDKQAEYRDAFARKFGGASS